MTPYEPYIIIGLAGLSAVLLLLFVWSLTARDETSIEARLRPYSKPFLLQAFAWLSNFNLLDSKGKPSGIYDLHLGERLHRITRHAGIPDTELEANPQVWRLFALQVPLGRDIVRTRFIDDKGNVDPVNYGDDGVSYMTSYYARNWILAAKLCDDDHPDPYWLNRLVGRTELSSKSVLLQDRFFPYPNFMKALVLVAENPHQTKDLVSIGPDREMRDIMRKIKENIRQNPDWLETTLTGKSVDECYDIIQSLR